MDMNLPLKIEEDVGRAVSRVSSKILSVDELLSKELGSDYESYRNEWNLSFDNTHKIRNAPIHLDIEMQDFCNQACVMCPRDSLNHKDLPYELDTKVTSNHELIKIAIQGAAKEGLRSVNFGAFSEPLISKNLWELISFSHANGIVDSRVITNGILIDKYIDQIFSSGLVNLFVSLDAFTEPVYELIRGKGFNKVIKNLNSVIQRKQQTSSTLPIIRVSFVEMDQNRHEKDDFIRYWVSKVDHVDIQTWSDYKKPASQKEISDKKVFDCKSPWQRLAITARGEILPCCDFNGRNLVLGNINEISLTDAWSSDNMTKVRNDLQTQKSATCESCQRSRGITNSYLESYNNSEAHQ